jgi:hypothetical protein
MFSALSYLRKCSVVTDAVLLVVPLPVVAA